MLIIKLPEFPATQKVTKRTVLAHLAKPFDPLGIISPCILPAKMLMQELAVDKSLVGWDAEAKPDVQSRWLSIVANWTNISFEIPRLVIETNGSKGYEVHT